MDDDRRTLGFTGLALPRLGLRASQPFNIIGKESQTARASLIRAAMERGIDFFSTSPEFGEAERILSAGLIGYRHRAMVMTTIFEEEISKAYRQIDMALHLFDGRIDLMLAGSVAASDKLMISLARMRSSGEASAIGVECRSMDALREIAPRVTVEGLDLLCIAAPLLVHPETQSFLADSLPDHCGVVAYVPDSLEAIPYAGLDELKLDVGRHELTSLADVLLKLASSDPRILSVAAPARRRRDLDRIERIVYSPALTPVEMNALRTG